MVEREGRVGVVGDCIFEVVGKVVVGMGTERGDFKIGLDVV